jgi:hypothetical protein
MYVGSTMQGLLLWTGTWTASLIAAVRSALSPKRRAVQLS